MMMRQLYSGDAADFVKEKILPNVEKTMVALTDQEQTAACLLLSALIGFLAEGSDRTGDYKKCGYRRI